MGAGRLIGARRAGAGRVASAGVDVTADWTGRARDGGGVARRASGVCRAADVAIWAVIGAIESTWRVRAWGRIDLAQTC